MTRRSTKERGEGFFRRDWPYWAIFERMCRANRYAVKKVGDSQTTYFIFYPEALAETVGTTSSEFYFRHDGTELLLRFQLIPATADDQVARDRLLSNRGAFSAVPSGVPTRVTSRAKAHVGLVDRRIRFDPGTVTDSQLGAVIEALFRRDVVPFVDAVSKVVQETLDTAKG